MSQKIHKSGGCSHLSQEEFRCWNILLWVVGESVSQASQGRVQATAMVGLRKQRHIPLSYLFAHNLTSTAQKNWGCTQTGAKFEGQETGSRSAKIEENQESTRATPLHDARTRSHSPVLPNDSTTVCPAWLPLRRDSFTSRAPWPRSTRASRPTLPRSPLTSSLRYPSPPRHGVLGISSAHRRELCG